MRLFLAVELTDGVRRDIEAMQDRLRSGLEGWRWAQPHGIHLTMRFLGDVSEDVDARQRTAWSRAISACRRVRFRAAGLGVFPPRGPARVMWVGVVKTDPPGGLTAIGEALELAAREMGYRPERRPFRPHLTIARARHGFRAQRPAQQAHGAIEEMTAREVVLFRSDLSSDGARYTVLERFPLRG